MTAHLDATQPALLLRLLLGDERADPGELEWNAVPALAERHRIPLRLAACLEGRGAVVPPRFAEAAARARARAERVLALVARVVEGCDRRGITCVVLKLARDFPDVGGDIDLLVPDAGSAMDRLLRELPPIVRGRRTLRSHLAATTVYHAPEQDTAVDVHHRRLGHLGEHSRLAALLLGRRRRAEFGAVSCFVPSLEDQLVQQALAYGIGLPALRIGDALWTISAVRDGGLDWETVLRTAQATGLLPALSCHLSGVEQLHQRLIGLPLLNPEIRPRLIQRSWGRIEFRRGSYRLAGGRVRAGLFLRQLRAKIESRDWSAAGRLCLLPLVAASAGWQRVARAFG
ncbi:MAG: hypothetical protein DMD43_04160 [Gemmatimonadetes bacterium]|nr:MAG: hypothetical protein DMD43_04160 [Gemmatimonadota bacterium]